MVAGFSDSGGTRRASASSTLLCRSAMYSVNIIRYDSLVGSKRLRLHFTAPAHQYFDASFSLFELFAAGFAELHSAFEQLQRALKRQFPALHFLDDRLQLLKAGFETQLD